MIRLSEIRLDLLTLLVIGSLLPSCKSSKPASVTMGPGEVKRIEGCHIKLDSIVVHPKAPEPLAYFSFVCKVEESALNSKEWWGTQQPQPLLFNMATSDCTRLEKTFYCVEIDTSNATVTLKATYEQQHWDGALLKHIP